MNGEVDSQSSTNNRFWFGLISNKLAYLIAFVFALLSLAMVVILWYQLPSYVVLLKGVDATRLASVAAEMQHNNISYQYDPASGNLLVLEQDLGHARMVLAARPGMSNSKEHSGAGRDDSVSFSEPAANSSFHALEKELAKTIASIDYVQSARVHLAVSELQNDKQSSASIVVRLAPGRRLTETQISSISHLVAASTPGLSLENITIVDQSGRLLKSIGALIDKSLTTDQLNVARRIEQYYVERIENILAPIVGLDAMRIQVTADVDSGARDGEANDIQDINQGLGNVQRLSIALVIDDKLKTNSEGRPVKVSWSRREIKNITKLTKKAVGFDAKRGDSVNIINESFNVSPGNIRYHNVSSWSQSQLLDAIKIISILFLIVTFAYLAIRKLAGGLLGLNSILPAKESGSVPAHNVEIEKSEIMSNQETTESANNSSAYNKPLYEQLIAKTRELVHQDPEQVAQILKLWVRQDGK